MSIMMLVFVLVLTLVGQHASAQAAQAAQAGGAREAEGLPAGTPVLGSDPLRELSLQQPGRATTQFVSVTGQPFDRALQIRTLLKPEQTYNIQLRAFTRTAVQEGDVLLATFYLRGLETTAADGRVQTSFVFEERQAPNTKSTLTTVSAPANGEWVLIQIPFVARRSHPAGEAQVAIRVGFDIQTLEIGGLEVVNYGNQVSVDQLTASGHAGYDGMEPDAAWRQAAYERIDAIRKGDLEIQVVDAAGNPVAGADVSVRMTRHAFPFGTAVGAELLRDPLQARYRAEIERLFNVAVIESALKWNPWETGGGDYHGPRAISWLRQRGIPVRGHHLLMSKFASVPADVQRMLNERNFEGVQERILGHMRSIVSELRGQVIAWDVLNEPDYGDNFLHLFGDRKIEFIRQWFETVREADPDAQLFVNQAVILTRTLNDEAGSMRGPFEELLTQMVEHDVPFDAIGFQGHFGSVLTPPEEMLQILDRFAKFGKPIWITEFDVDIRDQQMQAQFTRDFYITMFSHPSVEGILMWGFWDGRHWKYNAPIYNADWTLKPSGEAWIDLIFNEWWTQEDGQTDEQGRYGIRGFLGDYELEVRFGDRTVKREIALTREGTSIHVVLD